jgi:hypothetical protein
MPMPTKRDVARKAGINPGSMDYVLKAMRSGKSTPAVSKVVRAMQKMGVSLEMLTGWTPDGGDAHERDADEPMVRLARDLTAPEAPEALEEKGIAGAEAQEEEKTGLAAPGIEAADSEAQSFEPGSGVEAAPEPEPEPRPWLEPEDNLSRIERELMEEEKAEAARKGKRLEKLEAEVLAALSLEKLAREIIRRLPGSEIRLRAE